MTAPLATLERLNPDFDAFMMRIINRLALCDERPPMRSRRRFPSPQRVKEKRDIDEDRDDADADISGTGADEADEADDDMDTSSEDETAKKPRAARSRVAKVVARPPAMAKRQKMDHVVSAIAKPKSIAVHCDSYVPQSVLPEMPRFIIENVKTEATLAKGNNNVKNLYDALHLITKGEIGRALHHHKKFRAGKCGVIMKKRWEAYKKNVTSLPTCDFYILVQRDANPLKTVFLKMTLPFWRMQPHTNNCLLPKEFLHELGATFLLAPRSDTTKMTFTDVTAGSPGNGYKFNLPVYDDDAEGSSDRHVTFAFMVEISILKDGTAGDTDDDFIHAPLLPSFVIPAVESSATGLVDHLEHAPAPASTPPADAPPADAPPAGAPPADAPPADAPPADAPPADDPPADAPPAAGAALSMPMAASGGDLAEPSRAEPPSPINEKDFWSLAPNYPLIRNRVFAVFRTTMGNITIDDATCTALDNAYKMLVESGTRYTDTQMVVEVVKRMKVALMW